VQTAAEAAVKDLAAKEKEEVELQERKKHGTTKAKKLRKSLADVRRFCSLMHTTDS
jgi:structural maintenance of chromosome 4